MIDYDDPFWCTYREAQKLSWAFTFHDFWCQVAIAAIFSWLCGEMNIGEDNAIS